MHITKSTAKSFKKCYKRIFQSEEQGFRKARICIFTKSVMLGKETLFPNYFLSKKIVL